MFKNTFFVLASVLFGSSAFAYSTVDDAQVNRIYVQTLTGEHLSDAHAVSFNKDLDSSCDGRLFVLPEDKELFSTLLAYQLSGRTFSFMYSTGHPEKHIAGHLMSTCKIFSIY